MTVGIETPGRLPGRRLAQNETLESRLRQLERCGSVEAILVGDGRLALQDPRHPPAHVILLLA